MEPPVLSCNNKCTQDVGACRIPGTASNHAVRFIPCKRTKKGMPGLVPPPPPPPHLNKYQLTECVMRFVDFRGAQKIVCWACHENVFCRPHFVSLLPSSQSFRRQWIHDSRNSTTILPFGQRGALCNSLDMTLRECASS